MSPQLILVVLSLSVLGRIVKEEDRGEDNGGNLDPVFDLQHVPLQRHGHLHQLTNNLEQRSGCS